MIKIWCNLGSRTQLSSFLVALMILLTGCASNVDKTPEERRAELYYSHGTTNLMRKDYSNALKYLQLAEELSPDDSKVHNNLGMAFYFKKRNTKAVFHLKKAIDLDEKNSDARVNLASIYMQTGNYSEARRQYKAVLNDLVYKHQYRTYYNLSLVDIRENKISSALENLTKSIHDREDYCPALFQLGILEKRRANYEGSLKYFTEGAKNGCSNEPAPVYQKGLVLEKLGKFQRASALFYSINEKFPTSRYSAMASKRINLMAKTKKELKEAKYNKTISQPNEFSDKVEIPKPLSF